MGKKRRKQVYELPSAAKNRLLNTGELATALRVTRHTILERYRPAGMPYVMKVEGSGGYRWNIDRVLEWFAAGQPSAPEQEVSNAKSSE